MDKKIITLIKNACALKEKVTSESEISDLSIDSLSFIELIVRVEDEFKVAFLDEELDINCFGKVKDFINLIKEKKDNGKN